MIKANNRVGKVILFLGYYPAADQHITLIEYRRLTSCRISNRRIKLDLNLILSIGYYQRFNCLRRIADLHLRAERFRRRFPARPVDIASGQF